MRLTYLFVVGVSLLFLSACAAVPVLPDSKRLEGIKAARLPTIKTDIKQAALIPGAPVFIRIFKEEAVLELWMREDRISPSGVLEQGRAYRLYHTYPICAFSGTLGPKLREGDGQAPEGFYTVTADQLNPWSRYHLSFDLGFPNPFDRAHGASGSLLMVHGGCRSEGCYAMTDPAMEEIYMLVEMALARTPRVPVHIFPFRMNAQNMARHAGHKWKPFWQHLKPGYDAFESTGTPPLIFHRNRRYAAARVLGGGV